MKNSKAMQIAGKILAVLLAVSMSELNFQFLLLYIVVGFVFLVVTIKTLSAIWSIANSQKKIVQLLEKILDKK